MFYWIESVQGYNVDGWDYTTELKAFVDGGMTDQSFIDAVSGIVNRGCHNPPCGTGPLDGGMERADNFKKVLLALFGSSPPSLPAPTGSNSGNTNGQSSPDSQNGNTNGSDNTLDPGSSNNSSDFNGAGTAYYPDYNPIWSEGKCINDGEPPLGRPNHPTLEECCEKNYGGQASGICLGSVQDPSVGTDGANTGSEEAPISSPDSPPNSQESEVPNDEIPSSSNNDSPESGSTAFYPDYNPIWSLGKCVNDGEPPSGRPNYPTLEECCSMAYGGQASGICLGAAMDDSSDPPDENGPSFGSMWYPDYNSLWSMGKCTNALPFENGRPTYGSQLECCQNAYRGQASGVCLADVPDLPTSASDAVSNESSMWYGDYNPIWSLGKCVKGSLELPAPDNRPWYYSQLECCQKTYGGQSSGACLEDLSEFIPIEAEGSFADGFTSYIQSLRSGDLLLYSCDTPEILPSSIAIDVSYDYEFSVPKSVRADLVLMEVKRRMMEHVAGDMDCDSTIVPRKLRRTQDADKILGLQSSSFSDEIDTKTAHCRISQDEAFVCVPVVGHFVAFVDKGMAPNRIEEVKGGLLKSIASGEYTSESIQNVVVIGEHIVNPDPIQAQKESASSSRAWIPAIVSLLSILAVVVSVSYVVIRSRRSMKIQEHPDMEHCSGKVVIDCTARLSEYSLPTSAGEFADEHSDESEGQDSFCSDSLGSEQSQHSSDSPETFVEDIEVTSTNDNTADDSDQDSISLYEYTGDSSQYIAPDKPPLMQQLDQILDGN
jgi:hypothetical protein